MADLATLLGVQLQDKLGEISAALPQAVGYLSDQAHKGGQHTGPARTQGVNDPAPEAVLPGVPTGDETVLPDAALLQRGTDARGNKGFFRKPAEPTYLPPANGDQVVAPEQPLIVQRGGRAYLTAQVPVMNEKGQMVDVMGPKGAPTRYLQNQAQDAIVPIPSSNPIADEARKNTPYLEKPKDLKRQGLFIDHMKKMYGGMLQEIQNRYGIPM